jgi:predicted ABC-type transport system involved in lysophospholipase L1 biosynthesis ATPase subunit
LFRLNQEKGIALVVATHNREFAEKIGRRVELKDGQLVPWSASGDKRLYKNR